MPFSSSRPIRDVTENRLMTLFLAVTVVNLAALVYRASLSVPLIRLLCLVIGTVNRIPTENIAALIDTYTEAVLFKIMVFGANTSVVSLLHGKIEQCQ